MLNSAGMLKKIPVSEGERAAPTERAIAVMPAAAVPGVIRKYGREYVVQAGETVTLEGPNETRRIIVIQFPTLERAQEFYNSPEYQEARKLRKDAAEGELIAVEGV
jgi:uncharacterized protein (DUF1330 family)